MENPFGTAANKPQTETTGVMDLPLNVWFLARTSDRGGAVPSLKYSTDGTPFLFKTGLSCVGGDGVEVTQQMRNSYTFLDAYLRPNFSDQGGPQTQDDFDQLSGRMTGFMNACLSPGIEDKDARWANTQAQLVAYANVLAEETDPDRKLTGAMFEIQTANGETVRDNAAYMVSVFALLLQSSPRLVIVNQRVQKLKDGREKIVVGSFKDAISANAKTQKGKVIEPFPTRDGEVYELYGDSSGTGEDATTF
jgi:hypothetical protein